MVESQSMVSEKLGGKTRLYSNTKDMTHCLVKSGRYLWNPVFRDQRVLRLEVELREGDHV